MINTFTKIKNTINNEPSVKEVLSYSITIFLVWTIALGFIAYQAVQMEKNVTQMTITNIARLSFNKDLAYRKWATDHGGVYVEPTEKTPPSPWMDHIQDRDVVTEDGKKLTLMNPAYMLREMMSTYSELYGIKGRIVGKIYLNENNKADEWEADAIDKFDSGVKEVMEYKQKDGIEYLRLMKPMVMTQKCQKCHGHLGFENGTVRGGVSVSVPTREYVDLEKKAIQYILLTNILIWFFGVLAIILISLSVISNRKRKAKDILILEREKLESRTNLERLDRVLKGTSDGYWEWNLKTNEVYYSTQWKAMLGYEENEIKCELSEWEKLVHLDDIGGIWEKIQQHLEGEITQFTDEFRLLCKDETYKWIHTRGMITEYTQSGEPLIMSGTHTDISDRKILEYNLQEEKEKLLTQNILLKEKDELMYQQSRLAQMGEMISMIAHQWRQPLSAISTVAATVQVKLDLDSFNTSTEGEIAKKDEYISQQLSSIAGLVVNLSDTIDDFRNFYKPNKEVVSIKLSDIISKSLSVIESSLKNNNITINITDNVDSAVGIYDSELMQVVLNLLKNAQDNFLEKNIQEATIDIDITNTSIKIVDNGGGIEEKILSKIFDPYFSTKDNKNGTGLGLYMSKIIIEDHHNGKLTVKNTDAGACFTIALQVGGGL